MSYKVFTEEDYLLLGNSDPRLKYKRTAGEIKKSIMWGQRKLIVSEIQFFNYFWDPIMHPTPTVVYVGAAPGTHITLLSEMFPTFIFHLYDPQTFLIKETEKIKIFRQFFTDEIAEKYKDMSIYFISDIRTGEYSNLSDIEKEKAVIRDMQFQERWYNIINPIKAQLKFKLPYPKEGQTHMEYLDGYLFKQPWSPQTTSETRLVPVKGKKIHWNLLVYEEQIFYHNRVVREEFNYYNIYTKNKKIPYDPPELLNDYDSTCEISILNDYLTKFGGITEASFLNAVALSKKITTSLNRGSKIIDTLAEFRRDPLRLKRRVAKKKMMK
jgi:hypothetical protein